MTMVAGGLRNSERALSERGNDGATASQATHLALLRLACLVNAAKGRIAEPRPRVATPVVKRKRGIPASDLTAEAVLCITALCGQRVLLAGQEGVVLQDGSVQLLTGGAAVVLPAPGSLVLQDFGVTLQHLVEMASSAELGQHLHICSTCMLGGADLLLCCGCPNAFHQSCVAAHLPDVGAASSFCPTCQQDLAELPRSAFHRFQCRLRLPVPSYLAGAIAASHLSHSAHQPSLSATWPIKGSDATAVEGDRSGNLKQRRASAATAGTPVKAELADFDDGPLGGTESGKAPVVKAEGWSQLPVGISPLMAKAAARDDKGGVTSNTERGSGAVDTMHVFVLCDASTGVQTLALWPGAQLVQRQGKGEQDAFDLVLGSGMQHGGRDACESRAGSAGGGAGSATGLPHAAENCVSQQRDTGTVKVELDALTQACGVRCEGGVACRPCTEAVCERALNIDGPPCSCGPHIRAPWQHTPTDSTGGDAALSCARDRAASAGPSPGVVGGRRDVPAVGCPWNVADSLQQATAAALLKFGPALVRHSSWRLVVEDAETRTGVSTSSRSCTVCELWPLRQRMVAIQESCNTANRGSSLVLPAAWFRRHYPSSPSRLNVVLQLGSHRKRQVFAQLPLMALGEEALQLTDPQMMAAIEAMRPASSITQPWGWTATLSCPGGSVLHAHVVWDASPTRLLDDAAAMKRIAAKAWADFDRVPGPQSRQWSCKRPAPPLPAARRGVSTSPAGKAARTASVKVKSDDTEHRARFSLGGDKASRTAAALHHTSAGGDVAARLHAAAPVQKRRPGRPPKVVYTQASDALGDQSAGGTPQRTANRSSQPQRTGSSDIAHAEHLDLLKPRGKRARVPTWKASAALADELPGGEASADAASHRDLSRRTTRERDTSLPALQAWVPHQQTYPSPDATRRKALRQGEQGTSGVQAWEGGLVGRGGCRSLSELLSPDPPPRNGSSLRTITASARSGSGGSGGGEAAGGGGDAGGRAGHSGSDAGDLADWDILEQLIGVPVSRPADVAVSDGTGGTAALHGLPAHGLGSSTGLRSATDASLPGQHGGGSPLQRFAEAPPSPLRPATPPGQAFPVARVIDEHAQGAAHLWDRLYSGVPLKCQPVQQGGAWGPVQAWEGRANERNAAHHSESVHPSTREAAVAQLNGGLSWGLGGDVPAVGPQAQQQQQRQQRCDEQRHVDIRQAQHQHGTEGVTETSSHHHGSAAQWQRQTTSQAPLTSLEVLLHTLAQQSRQQDSLLQDSGGAPHPTLTSTFPGQPSPLQPFHPSRQTHVGLATASSYQASPALPQHPQLSAAGTSHHHSAFSPTETAPPHLHSGHSQSRLLTNAASQQSHGSQLDALESGTSSFGAGPVLSQDGHLRHTPHQSDAWPPCRQDSAPPDQHTGRPHRDQQHGHPPHQQNGQTPAKPLPSHQHRGDRPEEHSPSAPVSKLHLLQKLQKQPSVTLPPKPSRASHKQSTGSPTAPGRGGSVVRQAQASHHRKPVEQFEGHRPTAASAQHVKLDWLAQQPHHQSSQQSAARQQQQQQQHHHHHHQQHSYMEPASVHRQQQQPRLSTIAPLSQHHHHHHQQQEQQHPPRDQHFATVSSQQHHQLQRQQHHEPHLLQQQQQHQHCHGRASNRHVPDPAAVHLMQRPREVAHTVMAGQLRNTARQDMPASLAGHAGSQQDFSGMSELLLKGLANQLAGQLVGHMGQLAGHIPLTATAFPQSGRGSSALLHPSVTRALPPLPPTQQPTASSSGGAATAAAAAVRLSDIIAVGTVLARQVSQSTAASAHQVVGGVMKLSSELMALVQEPSVQAAWPVQMHFGIYAINQHLMTWCAGDWSLNWGQEEGLALQLLFLKLAQLSTTCLPPGTQ